MVVRIFIGVLLTAFTLLIAAAGAQAGSYHVYACRTPAGESAPADGWSGSVTGTYSYTRNTCQEPGGGALLAALGDQTSRTANTDFATWAFSAPSWANVTGATLWRAGDADGGGTLNASYQFWFAGPNNLNNPANAFGQCVSGSSCPAGVGNTSQPFAPENRIVVASSHLGSHIYVNATCSGETGFPCPEGEHDPNGYAAAIYLYAADITLEQAAGPTAGNVGGELASAATVQGTSDVTFSASDPGAGVYEAVFSVDGQVVQDTVLNENGGRCRNVGETADGLAAFVYVQPCVSSLSADVGLDTTRLSNGSHHLVVSVLDAAGNSAPVLDRTITVANPPPPGVPGPPNGTPASAQASLSASWSGTRKTALVTPYGRAASIAGRLTAPGGTPIVGAEIEMTATPAFAGAKSVTTTVARTGTTGRFAVHLQGGASSRSLRLSYSYRVGEARPVATSTLRLAVRAGISVSIAPRTTSVGHSIYFRGRLLGGPVPGDGKQLVLEARSPGSPWLEFDVIRTDRQGRFHAIYRFKFPGPADYQFRVLSEPESDYPFAAGYSGTLGVYER